MIGKLLITAAVPAAVLVAQEVPPNDPVDVAWATVISVLVTRLLEWWLDRRKTRRDRFRK